MSGKIGVVGSIFVELAIALMYGVGMNDWEAISQDTLYAKFGERYAFWIFAILALVVTSRRWRPSFLRIWPVLRLWAFTGSFAFLNSKYYLSVQGNSDKLVQDWTITMFGVPFFCLCYLGIALLINLLLENMFQRTSGRRSR